jgi:hypothetical protein
LAMRIGRAARTTVAKLCPEPAYAQLRGWHRVGGPLRTLVCGSLGVLGWYLERNFYVWKSALVQCLIAPTPDPRPSSLRWGWPGIWRCATRRTLWSPSTLCTRGPLGNLPSASIVCSPHCRSGPSASGPPDHPSFLAACGRTHTWRTSLRGRYTGGHRYRATMIAVDAWRCRCCGGCCLPRVQGSWRRRRCPEQSSRVSGLAFPAASNTRQFSQAHGQPAR